MDNKEKLRIRKSVTPQNYNVFELSNGTKIITLMNFPKSAKFFRDLENFSNEHCLPSLDKYLQPPYVYGQIIMNNKVIFLEYMEPSEEVPTDKIAYEISNIITPEMIQKTYNIYCEHEIANAELRLNELMSFSRRALNQNKVFQKTYYDKRKYYDFLFELPDSEITFFSSLDDNEYYD